MLEEGDDEKKEENQEPEGVEGSEGVVGVAGAGGTAGATTFAPRVLFRMDALLDALRDTLRRLFPNGPAEFISIFSV